MLIEAAILSEGVGRQGNNGEREVGMCHEWEDRGSNTLIKRISWVRKLIFLRTRKIKPRCLMLKGIKDDRM